MCISPHMRLFPFEVHVLCDFRQEEQNTGKSVAELRSEIASSMCDGVV